MDYRKFKNKYILRIDKGEEILSAIKKLCEEENITLGFFSGIGATNKATIGLFETSTKKYHSKELTGDHEITALTGNISVMKGEVYLHSHVNLVGSEYNTYGGHLNSAVVSGTCEVTVEAFTGQVDREFNEEVGLNLYKF